MPLFKVSLHGDNFWLKLEGKPARLGFYTARFLEALDESNAELRAVQMLRESPSLKSILNGPGDPPIVHCESIEVVESLEEQQPGLVFYPAEDNG
jgi:hypothetical protein